MITITVDQSKPRAECHRGGAADNGLCLKCTVKAMGEYKLKSSTAKAVRARFRAAKTEAVFPRIADALRQEGAR